MLHAAARTVTQIGDKSVSHLAKVCLKGTSALAHLHKSGDAAMDQNPGSKHTLWFASLFTLYAVHAAATAMPQSLSWSPPCYPITHHRAANPPRAPPHARRRPSDPLTLGRRPHTQTTDDDDDDD